LTQSGHQEAKRGWKSYISAPHPPNDVDAILRLVDIAMHYSATQADVTHFLQRAAEAKAALATQTGAKLFPPAQNPLSYEAARTLCDYTRIGAEAATLKSLAATSASRGRQQGVAARRAIKVRQNPRELLSFDAEGDAEVDQKG